MRVKLYLFMAFLVMATPSLSKGADPSQPQNSVAADEVAAPPSMELLEFLGEWETDDGEWLDPTKLDLMLLLDQEYSDE